MSIRQISVASTVLLMIYVIQESVVSQLRLPGGGFSILLIFALTWAVLSETEVAAVIGFAAGFLMDLSQTAAGPLCHRDYLFCSHRKFLSGSCLFSDCGTSWCLIRFICSDSDHLGRNEYLDTSDFSTYAPSIYSITRNDL